MYVDILVKMGPDSVHYATNTGAFPAGSPTAQFGADGFVSLACHGKGVGYTGNSSDSATYMLPDETTLASFAVQVKVASLDGDGRILALSGAARVIPTQAGTYAQYVTFNRQSGLSVSFQGPYTYILRNPYAYPYLKLLIPLALTLAVEIGIAFPLRIKQKWKILLVNIVTQTLLNGFFLPRSWPWFSMLGYTYGYGWNIAIGEFVVYLLEFSAYLLWYRHKVSWRRIALYTVLANTASLGMGLVVNHFLGILNIV